MGIKKEIRERLSLPLHEVGIGMLEIEEYQENFRILFNIKVTEQPPRELLNYAPAMGHVAMMKVLFDVDTHGVLNTGMIVGDFKHFGYMTDKTRQEILSYTIKIMRTYLPGIKNNDSWAYMNYLEIN